MLAFSASAHARAPVLETVDAVNGRIKATWSQPPGVASRFIEFARSPNTIPDGYFNQTDYATFRNLKPDQRSFESDFAFSAATYYIHVAGEDTQNGLGVCPGREFSNILVLEVRADGSGRFLGDYGGGSPECPKLTGGGGGGSGGGGASDRRRPRALLSAPRIQDVDKLYVAGWMDEPGTLTATARVNVAGGASRVYRFRRVRRGVRPNQRAKMRLRLARKSLRAVKRSLARGRRLRARVTLTARDRAGNTRVRTVAIRLTN